jgi:hypothetical protein
MDLTELIRASKYFHRVGRPFCNVPSAGIWMNHHANAAIPFREDMKRYASVRERHSNYNSTRRYATLGVAAIQETLVKGIESQTRRTA